MGERVEVSSEVYSGLEAVRQSGETNMFDYRAVVSIAERMGYTETMVWIIENTSTYIEGIFAGFEPIEVENG